MFSKDEKFFFTVLNVFCPILSTLCFLMLCVTWYLMPRWRTLQNYMGIQRICLGTIHLVMCTLYYSKPHTDPPKQDPNEIISRLIKTVYLASVCWCSSSLIVAYVKLVLRYTGIMTRPKTKVTIMTYAAVAIIETICEVIGRMVTADKPVVCLLRLLALTIITTLNLFLFFKVTKSILSGLKKSMGIAMVCDSIIMILTFRIACRETKNSEKLMPYIILLVSIRMIPQAFVILLNRSSRSLWKSFVEKQGRRGSRVII